MGFEQLAALRDQLAAQAAKDKRPARKPAAGQEKAPRQAAGKPSAPKPKAAQKPRKEQPAVEPVVLNISRLQRQYPQAFPKRPDPKVPLKLGIHNDLYAQAETLGLTQPEIKEAIQTWCQGARYWNCLVLDAARIDLAGEPAGTVTEAEAKRAKQLASRQRWQARSAQKKAAAESAASAGTQAAGTAPTATDDAHPGADTAIATAPDATAGPAEGPL